MLHFDMCTDYMQLRNQKSLKVSGSPPVEMQCHLHETIRYSASGARCFEGAFESVHYSTNYIERYQQRQLLKRYLYLKDRRELLYQLLAQFLLHLDPVATVKESN